MNLERDFYVTPLRDGGMNVTITDTKMKITEETKIKDIIPEGYELKIVEFDPNVFLEKSVICQYGQVCIPLVQKSKKDFKWYYGEYLRSNREDLARWLTKGANDYTYDLLVGQNYEEIEFEIKMGLMRFIFVDLELSMDDMYHYLRVYYTDMLRPKFVLINSIVPEEFLDSIT